MAYATKIAEIVGEVQKTISPAERLQNALANSNPTKQQANSNEAAVKIDTGALFVRTPDGTMHVKTADGYSPNISATSYVKKD